jgi:Sulfotransferase domain
MMSPATPFTTVVTGLPRSGTSLAMQLLHAGGVPILTDRQRAPDEDNPRGYFEMERVKRLAADPAALDGSPGHAVKVIHLLIPHLPEDRPYRVLFMQRDPMEVIRSQQIMLSRTSTSSPPLAADRLADIYAAQLALTRAWLTARPDIGVLEISYARLIAAPAAAVAEISRFLGGNLDLPAMTAAVVPSLHRNRS